VSKYEALGNYLRVQKVERLRLSFSEIEKILNAKLPPSKRHRAWWSNNPSNNVMTKQWLDAGFETADVDVEGQKLVFRKLNELPAVRELHSIFGCMKGEFTLAPGYDPTAPAGEDWLASDVLGHGTK